MTNKPWARPGRRVLKYPDELQGFTHLGVQLIRETPLNEQGRYRAIITRNGKQFEFLVKHEGTKRYGWSIFRLPAREGFNPCVEMAHDLIQVAERIASRKW